jgi:hypothetical protein
MPCLTRNAEIRARKLLIHKPQAQIVYD